MGGLATLPETAVIAFASLWLLAVASLARGLLATRGGAAEGRMLHRMPLIVSLGVLLAGLYIVTAANYSGDDRIWGYGLLGAVAGYWLRGSVR